MDKDYNKFNGNSPLFSILILFWNNGEFIHRCLNSLQKQTFDDFEVILINNGSDQPLPDITEFSLLTIKVYQLSENIGFAAGNNLGVDHANGKYVITLNADAFPELDWLENIHKPIQKYPNSFFASKLIMANNPSKLDGVGDVYHFTGQVWRKYHNYSESSLKLIEQEVFSPCGAAAIYPKDAFEKVGGFDPDFFAYVEDVDLGFRLRLAGNKCIFLPEAVVHHVGSGSTGRRSDFSVYYGQRNLVWTFFKNMPGVLFWILLPFHLLMNILTIFLSFFRKQGKVTIKAKLDAFKEIPQVIKKRNPVQRNRSVSIVQLIKVLDWNPFSPWRKLFHR